MIRQDNSGRHEKDGNLRLGKTLRPGYPRGREGDHLNAAMKPTLAFAKSTWERNPPCPLGMPSEALQESFGSAPSPFLVILG